MGPKKTAVDRYFDARMQSPEFAAAYREERASMEAASSEALSVEEAAKLLGVVSPDTVKNWLEGGHFPGAFQSEGGHWRFPKADVLAVRRRLVELEKMPRAAPPDVGEDGSEPPLL